MSDLIDGDMFEPAPVEMREADIQERCIDFARKHGVYCRKFSSPANRSVPDYLQLWNGYQWFTEFKRPGKLPTRQQYEEHTAIRANGGIVWVCDDVDTYRARLLWAMKVGSFMQIGHDDRGHC